MRSLVQRWPFILPLVVITVLVGVFTKRLVDIDRGADPHTIPSVLINQPLPAFSLAPLPGREATDEPFSDADLKGHVILLNVFGSWCVSCLEEHPTLLEIARTGLVPIVGIDWRDTPERAEAWLKSHRDPYARIGQDPDSRAAIALGVTGAPETFLIDADGIIRFKQTGPITPEVWNATLRPLIEKLQK
jgi:cytochrome c biogenesis protein CcmG/thiol:disulfide interchange protein DsbE